MVQRTIVEGGSLPIISRKKLRAEWTRNPALEAPLRSWIQVVEHARWGSFAEVRATFPRVDRVEDHFVFEVLGNRYRLICGIDFERGRVYLGELLTHAEYDRGRWKRD